MDTFKEDNFKCGNNETIHTIQTPWGGGVVDQNLKIAVTEKTASLLLIFPNLEQPSTLANDLIRSYSLYIRIHYHNVIK